mmetsp:Transcript_39446/g.77612  ORF Transcript_39446/g.77612 Transcript_39446/m.77612 type:complete len:256 (-) Transcript_39446:130-897(-)
MMYIVVNHNVSALCGHKIAVVGGNHLHILPHHILLDLTHFFTSCCCITAIATLVVLDCAQICQPCNLYERDVFGQAEADVRGNGLRFSVQLFSVHRDHSFDVKRIAINVVRPTPWRCNVYNIRLELGDERHVVPKNEINLVCHAIYHCVVTSTSKPHWIDIDCDDELTGLGELDRITAHSTEGIDDNVAGASLCNVDCDLLWSHTVPAHVVHHHTVVVQRKQKKPLGVVFVVLLVCGLGGRLGCAALLRLLLPIL